MQASEAAARVKRGRSSAKSDWWRDAVIYQIYPRSFADADGDGLGDIPGITAHLDYVAALGVDAIWLSPFYPSPQIDAGYDVADYFDVAAEYGTLHDFDVMVSRAHELGLKVIIDLVPNHTSSKHKWFQAALTSSVNSPERSRYWFRYSQHRPPNNWGSIFGGSAWQPVQPLSGREEDAGWWYLHLFAPEQPDLNWNNPSVQEMFLDFLRFWTLEHHVDGFRVDVAHGLVKAPGLPDDAVGSDRLGIGAQNAGAAKPADVGPMFDQDGVHAIYRHWRRALDAIRPGLLLVAEAWVSPPERLARYVRADEMNQAFNFDYLKAPWDGVAMRTIIVATTAANAQVGAPTTWVLSNHDVVRHASRFGLPLGTRCDNGIGITDPQPDMQLGLRRARAATLFTLALPGSMYLFQGEELGLPEHTTMPDAARQDPTWVRSGKTVRGRDGCRVPLPWCSSAPAFGFNRSGKTWLPQPKNWGTFAPDLQIGKADSTLEMYRLALRLRRCRELGTGNIVWLTPPSQLLVFRNGSTVIAFNMGSEEHILECSGKVLISSGRVVKNAGKRLLIPANTTVWLGE